MLIELATDDLVIWVLHLEEANGRNGPRSFRSWGGAGTSSARTSRTRPGPPGRSRPSPWRSAELASGRQNVEAALGVLKLKS